MKKLLFLLFISMVYFQTYAIPAYPYPITFTQPNGEEITFLLKGDEFLHWAVTLDGYTLLANEDGFYCYAQRNANGDLEPSTYTATEISNRSPQVNAWLQKLNTGLYYSNEQVFNYLQLRQMAEQEQEKSMGNPRGVRKLLVILMEFPDRPLKRTVEDFNLLLNQINYTEGGISGSMKDYYFEASYNKYEVTCTVAGPYTTEQNATYYPNQTQTFAREAIMAAYNDGVNLSEFAEGGVLPSFYAIYAGYDASAGCPETSCIWAHKWQLASPLNLGGIMVSTYACSSELKSTIGSAITDIGVICHEFGHSISASDYYDTNGTTGGSYDGTGEWDIMAGGSWNNNGTTPPMHNPRTKVYTYQWATAYNLTTPQKVTVPLSRIYDNAYYRIDIPHSDSYCTQQFFIIENRMKSGFDAYIPGNGLVIYKCTENYDNSTYNKNTTSWQRFYPVSANAPVSVPTAGSSSKSQYGSINSGSCPWPGTGNKTNFTNTTTPAMVSWGGNPVNKPITNIQVFNDYITFDFMGGGTKSNFNVFLPAYYGCMVTAQPGSTSPVNAGGSFAFKVEKLPSHNKSNIKVTANNIPLTPGTDNIYTISNIQEDQIVRIEGVTFNTFPITATAASNGTITPNGEVPVNYGGIKKFDIKPNIGYSVDKVTVDGADLGEIESYTFKNVLEPHNISATFRLGGIYTINSSIDSAYFTTSTNKPSEVIMTTISSPDIISNISVEAPDRFQISNNGTSNWSKSFSIAKSSLPYKLYIRFFPPDGEANVGTFNEILTLKATKAYADIKLKGVSTLGVNDFEKNQAISIYPNPTTGQLIIKSEKLQIDKVEIFDVYGKIISSQYLNISTSQLELDVTNLHTGVYIIAIQTDNGIVHKKIVKE